MFRHQLFLLKSIEKIVEKYGLRLLDSSKNATVLSTVWMTLQIIIISIMTISAERKNEVTWNDVTSVDSHSRYEMVALADVSAIINSALDHGIKVYFVDFCT